MRTPINAGGVVHEWGVRPLPGHQQVPHKGAAAQTQAACQEQHMRRWEEACRDLGARVRVAGTSRKDRS